LPSPPTKVIEAPLNIKDHLCAYIWMSNNDYPNPWYKKTFKAVKMTTAKWTSI
jgi:hypothetical protein